MSTIFALATPAHPSPVALVRISGTDALQKGQTLLSASGEFDPSSRRAIETTIALPLGNVPAAAWVLPGPYTLTGEDTIELRLPGNPAIVRQLEERLRELGFRDAEPGEFTRRALEAGKLDLSRAEAVLQLINASDETARRQAVADLSGDTAAQLSALTERLRAISARFEMSFDFSEEEHAQAEEDRLRADLAALAADLAAVVETGQGRPARERPVIALFGPPNAGKSTLFNALLGRPRALVSETPGTTRDPVEAEARLGSHDVLLVDLSGVGTGDLDRGRFSQTARQRALQADLLLLLEAPENPETAPGFAPLEAEDAGVRSRAIWVHTKRDLAEPAGNTAGLESVAVSAVSGGGLDDLRARLTDRLDQLATGGATSLLRLRSREALRLLQSGLKEELPPEAAASDVRRALRLLDEALLSEAPGEVLDLIFSRFCIGK
jgi:tRNA modification GTPase